MSARIERLPVTKVAYIHHSGPLHEIYDAFSMLMEWAALADVDVAEEQVLVVASDDPSLAVGERTSYDAAITVKDGVEGTVVVGIEEVGGGDYVVVDHIGGYDTLAEGFVAAGEAASADEYVVRRGPALVFIDSVEGTPPAESVAASIYVPVEAA